MIPTELKAFAEYIKNNDINYYILRDAWKLVRSPRSWHETEEDLEGTYRNVKSFIHEKESKVKLKDLIEYLQTLNPEAKLEVEEYKERITDAGSDLGRSYTYPLEIIDLETRIVFKKKD